MPTWPSWIVKPHELPLEPLDKPSPEITRVCAGCRDDRGLESEIDILDLTHSRYLTIVDIDKDRNIVNVESIKNVFSTIPRKTALIVAYWIVESGVSIVIASGYCHNMTYYLDQSGVVRLTATGGERLIDVLKKFNLIS